MRFEQVNNKCFSPPSIKIDMSQIGGVGGGNISLITGASWFGNQEPLIPNILSFPKTEPNSDKIARKS